MKLGGPRKKTKLSNGQKRWLAPRIYCVCRISDKKTIYDHDSRYHGLILSASRNGDRVDKLVGVARLIPFEWLKDVELSEIVVI